MSVRYGQPICVGPGGNDYGETCLACGGGQRTHRPWCAKVKREKAVKRRRARKRKPDAAR